MQKTRILIVEDSEDTRNFVKKALTIENFNVFEAGDGIAGYELVNCVNPDLMILDLNLPGMDGVELCAKLRKDGVKIPIIMLTARNEPENRVRGLVSGADDYMEKPFNLTELIHRVRIQLRHVSEARTLAENLLKNKWEEINEGLRLISQTHRPFFHSPEVEGIQSAVHYMPFGKIGGDFYRIAPVDDNKVEFLIGDAVGKGLPAAFLMASVFSHLYRLAKTSKTPAEIFTECNEILRSEFLELNSFVAAFFAFYDASKGTLTFSSAGHQPPILIKRNGFRHYTLRTEGYFIGAFDDGQYENGTIKIEPGDRIFFYTDGLLDIRDNEGRKLNFPSLYKTMLKNRNKDIKSLSSLLIDEYRSLLKSNAEVRDDLTFFFVEF